MAVLAPAEDEGPSSRGWAGTHGTLVPGDNIEDVRELLRIIIVLMLVICIIFVLDYQNKQDLPPCVGRPPWWVLD